MAVDDTSSRRGHRSLLDALFGEARELERRRRRRYLLLAVLACVVVAAVAVTLNGGGSPSAGRGLRASLPTAASASVQRARRELIDHFAIFRRPQTTADRNTRLVSGEFIRTKRRGTGQHSAPGLMAFFKRFGNPKLDPLLMRVVSLPELDAKVGFLPATWSPSRRSSGRSEGLVISMWIGAARTIPPAQEFGSGPAPTSVGKLLAHGLSISSLPTAGNRFEGVLVVPDGVAKVTLRPIRLIYPPAPINPAAFGTTTATVTNNVASLRLAIPTGVNRHAPGGIRGVPAIAADTWYDASGHVIRQTTTRMDLLIRVHGR